MASPFVAEIRMFAFDLPSGDVHLPPAGWAYCDGQLLPLGQNTALFALLGTVYGGDGKTAFALPDLRGRAPMHAGQMYSNSPLYELGKAGGSETVALLESQMPAHSHPLVASAADGISGQPSGQQPAQGVGINTWGPDASRVTLADSAIASSGGTAAHNNMQPYLTLNFCIALQGVFPPRP